MTAKNIRRVIAAVSLVVLLGCSIDASGRMLEHIGTS